MVGWLDDECLERLAAQNLNGRQIKNTVRTAQALASSDGCELDIKHIDQSLTAMSLFELGFAEDDGCDEMSSRDQRSSKRRRLS